MEIHRVFATIDTHTAGGPTRIITAGVPFLRGTNVAEKFAYFKENYDSIRKLLLTEPRGHRDAYGAVVTEPTCPNADLGVFFMTASDYLPTCVHSSIGVAAALVHTGALKQKQPGGEFVFETPAGAIALEPNFRERRLTSVGVRTSPAYIQSRDVSLRVGGKELRVSLAFSGVFFVLINAGQNGMDLKMEKLSEFIAIGKQILAEANQRFATHHSELPNVTGFALALFYEPLRKNHFKDVVIGRTGAVDRSPCGAGAGALAVHQALYEAPSSGDHLVIEGLIGTHFEVEIIRRVEVGGYPGGIPRVRGTAYVTGFHQFVLDAEDPLREGFVFG